MVSWTHGRNNKRENVCLKALWYPPNSERLRRFALVSFCEAEVQVALEWGNFVVWSCYCSQSGVSCGNAGCLISLVKGHVLVWPLTLICVVCTLPSAPRRTDETLPTSQGPWKLWVDEHCCQRQEHLSPAAILSAFGIWTQTGQQGANTVSICTGWVSLSLSRQLEEQMDSAAPSATCWVWWDLDPTCQMRHIPVVSRWWCLPPRSIRSPSPRVVWRVDFMGRISQSQEPLRCGAFGGVNLKLFYSHHCMTLLLLNLDIADSLSHTDGPELPSMVTLSNGL